MDYVTALIGRLHPLLVHLPIGVLVMAFLFECISAQRRFHKLRKAVKPLLLWGVLFAGAAAVSGYFLRQEGGYDEVIAERHQNLGIATAVLSLVVYVLRSKVKYWVNPSGRKVVKIALFFPLMVVLILTGHWGGALTHGEDYLFAPSSQQLRVTDPRERIRQIGSATDAELYADIVQPILEARCYDCHSSRRQKGDLRLDDISAMLQGGKNGPVIVTGPADSSQLYRRLVLPIEHDDHMPPREKAQLSSAEIDLIRYWVEGTAHFDQVVATYPSRENIVRAVRTLQDPSEESWIPDEGVRKAPLAVTQRLHALQVNVRPVAESSSYLMVSFAGQKTVLDEQLEALTDVKDQLVWLNLSHTHLKDEQVVYLSSLLNLRVLYLNGTTLSAQGVKHLTGLKKLAWLNLSDTRVTDDIVDHLIEMPGLRRLYLFNTSLSREGIARIEGRRQEVRIDTGGYFLPRRASDTVIYKRPSG